MDSRYFTVALGHKFEGHVGPTSGLVQLRPGDTLTVQFDFLRTNCEATDTQRMVKVVDNTGGRRLTYKPLTARDVSSN